MFLELWLSLAVICILGAISPGPSLAVVVRNTINGGKQAGIATAVSHGIAIGLYALIVVTGIGLVIVKSPMLFDIIRYSGAVFLIYLAYNSLKSSGSKIELTSPNKVKPKQVNAWRDGFLIAFLNPKIALFFIALFSQFVDENATIQQNLILVCTVGIIDTIWYCLVALGLSRGPVLNKLKSNSAIIDKITGVVLILLAIRVVI